jgi:tetratricopeptide (TPR) repeat protein
MFKLLQKIWNLQSSLAEDNENATLSIQSSQEGDVESTIKQADLLWQQGQLTEAINLYRQAIKKDPDAIVIYEQLALALKQQGNIAKAYEELATAFKQQGDTKEAANYYRQAIVLKALTWGAKEKYLQSDTTNNLAHPLKSADLKEMAFSFQPFFPKHQTKSNHDSLFSQLKNSSIDPGIVANGTNNGKATEAPKQINPHIQKALEYYEQKEWEQTASACEQAIKINQNQAEMYKIWGNALQRLGKTSEAMKCYAKVVEIQPDLAQVYANIGSLYSQQNKWQQAIEHYQKAIVIKPDFIEGYHQLADIWEKLGQPEKVLECNYQILEIESKQASSTTSNSLTESLSKLAIDQLLVETELDSVAAYQQLAQTCERENKWQEAAALYRQALQLNLSESLKSVAGEEQHLQPGLEKIQKVKNLVPQESAAAKAVALDTSKMLLNAKTEAILQQRNLNESQLDKAIRRYCLQAKLHPDSAKIQNTLGSLYAKKREWATAASCYQKAIALNSSYAEAYLNLAKVFDQVGKQDDSVAYLYQALTLKPKLASSQEHFHLGKSLSQQGKLEAAIACYYQAIALQSNFLEAYYCLAQLLSRRGRKTEALEYYQKAIEYAPLNPESYYHLGQEFVAQKQWQKAVEAFSHVLQLEPTYADASYQLNRALAQKLKSNVSS